MSVALWVAVPYVALTVFVVGHVWRWRTDRFGWTTRTTQLLESRLLRIGSPLFHLGAFAAIGGHVLGLLVPKGWTDAIGVSEHAYHLVSVTAGTVAGVMVVAGLVLLLARRVAAPRVRRTTSRMDVALFALLALVIGLGMAETVGRNLLGGGYDYRSTVAVWFRGVFHFRPDASLMENAPLVYRLHALSAWVLVALWPFTRLVHVWSAPVAYLWRPYIVYRRRAPRTSPASSAARSARHAGGSQAAPVPAPPTVAPSAPAVSASVEAGPSDRRRWSMLALATIGFALNFWAWALLSPLGPHFKETLRLTTFQQALLVAVPVVVGSVGRIPVGALTDRLGGRVMFPAVSAATIVPMLYLGLAGHSSLIALLAGGFFLGLAGTAFAVGVPFVSAWFPPHRRGLAIGVFGAGMGGTAISALTTVKLVTAHGVAAPFVVAAAVLAGYAVLAAVVLRDAPGRMTPAEPVAARLAAAARLGVTWQASTLYAVAFGGYVAFSVYLPTYLKTGYGLAQADAANRMAGFVLLGVLMRPVGGWLSDRIGPTRVLAGSLAVVGAGAAAQSFTPSLAPLGTIACLAMAAALGAGSGATFALVARVAPANRVGSVTGVVGAAGGLGGFVPPLVMGTIYSRFDTYGPGLVLLGAVAATALVFTVTAVRRELSDQVAAQVTGAVVRP